MGAVESIIEHEGFRAKPYPDPIHGWDVPTFGHGLTYITEKESLAIVGRRVDEIAARLAIKRPIFTVMPLAARDIIVEMAYQMGVEGVDNFSNMWAALAREDYKEAAEQMIDSKWAKQTPERAHALAARMASVA